MKSTILLCFCTVLVLRLETSTGTFSVQGPHHHPIYRYSCNEDLSVTFKGVNGTIQSVGKPCTIKPVPNHEGNFNIPNTCLSNQSFTATRTMQIAVYDKNEGEADPPTLTPIPPTTTPLISGGHHIFEITCLPLEKDGVERIALAETGITDIEQLHNVYNEIGQVEMRFKEGEGLDKPDLSQVYIGDIFYLYLKYMGKTEDYTIVPQTCTAYQGTYRTNDGKHMELWNQNNKGQCVSVAAKNYKVMENFKRDISTIVHAELHGFRFNQDSNGGVDDVTISCIVKICTGSSDECADNCGILPVRKKRGTEKIAGNRQKRSSGRIRSQTVSKTIKVQQRQFNSNDAGRISVHVGTIAIVITGIILNKQYH